MHASGADLTLKYAKKIDYLSPVWFNFRTKSISKTSVDFYIEGDHNVDKNYIRSIREKNPNIKVYPRVYIEATSYEDIVSILNQNEPLAIADKFTQLFREFGEEFDGILFDTPLLAYAKQLQFDIIGLMQLINEKLADINKDMIVSYMINQYSGTSDPALLEKLVYNSKKLLVCTYDYVSPKLGDNTLAPINWVKQQVEIFFDKTNLSADIIQKRVLMGIPFYGKKIDYTTSQRDAVINNEYIDILRNANPTIEWDTETAECTIKTHIPGKGAINLQYPCLKFIQSRLDMFEQFGVGAFVWEGGQGLPYFYELL